MKTRVIEAVIAKLQAELSSMLEAARAAHEAATNEESRSEDKHDTRGVEASYLAGAQLTRAGELREQLAVFKHLDPKPMAVTAAGALAELEIIGAAGAKAPDGKRSWVLLMTQGGGISVSVDGKTVQVVTPQSPLGDALMGRKAGEEFEVETGPTVREYRVASVS